MSKITGKAVIAQGGGPTAVINQSLVGAVLQARKYACIENIYGARYGVRGIVNEDFLDLTQATTHNLEVVARTPSSGMYSTRDKPDEAYCEKIFEVLKAHDVRYFYYVVGHPQVVVDGLGNVHHAQFIARAMSVLVDNAAGVG